MPDSIMRFDGLEILGTRSRGSGVFAAFDWKDLVHGSVTGAIAIKANDAERADRLSDFPPEDQPRLTTVLGHYSAVQSINSEDTVTWAVFRDHLSPWFSELLKQLYPDRNPPDAWRSELWKRTPHPDTGRLHHGPEADAILHADGWCQVVEAKWRSDIKDKQGKARSATQLEYRAQAALDRTGNRTTSGVLVIVPAPSRYPYANKPDSVFGRYFTAAGDQYRPRPEAETLDAVAVTWEQIAERLRNGSSVQREIALYLDWRLSFLDETGSRPTE